MKLKNLLIPCACGFVSCLCWNFYADAGIEPQVQRQVPSLAEIQELVGAEPDGIYGPETKAKWDRKTFNRFAAKFMTRTGGPK